MRRRTGDAVDGRHRARPLPHARFPFFPHHLDGGGRCHCRPAVPSVPHSGVCVGARCGRAASAQRHCVVRHYLARSRRGPRCLPVPGRHDGAGRARPPRRAVRLAGVVRGAARGRIGAAPVRPGVPGRHAGDGIPVQRCNGRGADAGGLRGLQGGPGQSPALPVRLCLHRQRGQLRVAHLQPGQSRGVRPAHAAAAAVAGAVRARSPSRWWPRRRIAR